jgi:hypothetical protein
MNEQRVFRVSDQTRRQDAARAAAARARRTIATKAAAAELSEEELALCAEMAEDENESLARLYVNGILVRVGLEWIGDGQELWEASLQS